MTNPVYVRLFYEDEAAALEWLTRVFGCRETDRKTNPDGSMMVWLAISDGQVMISRTGYGMQSPKTLGGISHRVNVYLDDVDSHYARARAEGADVQRELENMPWGDRRYEALDLEGHWWHFAQRLAAD